MEVYGRFEEVMLKYELGTTLCDPKLGQGVVIQDVAQVCCQVIGRFRERVRGSTSLGGLGQTMSVSKLRYKSAILPFHPPVDH